MFTSARSDLRSAVRSLRRSPGFTALAVLTLACGIGATAALFSLADAVLFRPLPFRDADQLVEIWGRNDQRTGMRVPTAILELLRARARTLQVVATHDPSGGVIDGPEGSIDIRGETVSANFNEVFGVQPLAGRPFVASDERPGSPAVMLVSFGFWRQHLGSADDAVGRIVRLDGMPYQVIGIMPREFSTGFRGAPPAFWTPYAGSRSREREQELGYEIVARLAPGATVDGARRELEALTSVSDFDGWRTDGRRVSLVPLREEIVGDRAAGLTLLLVASALVLLVACANLAQLLLARSETRRREFATRKAIGAMPVDIFRLALAESLILSVAGGMGGVALAYALVPVQLALAPIQIPLLASASIDLRVLTFAAAASLLTGCLFGLAPALRLSRLPLAETMRSGDTMGASGRTRFSSLLVVVQVAAAVILSVIGGLVAKTFLTLVPTSPGFATGDRASFIWSIDGRQYPDAADRRRRLGEWIGRMEGMPGNPSVAIASRIPFGDDESRNMVLRPAVGGDSDRATPLTTELRSVSRNYFALLEIALVRGRLFLLDDRAGAPRVAIVNQTLARRLHPSGDPVGQSIRLGTAANVAPYEIVGVVADTRWWGMTLEPLNEVYTPLEQDHASFGFLIIQSRSGLDELTRAIRASFYAALPQAALPSERRAVPLEELIDRSVAGPRFAAVLVVSFSAATFLLSAIGLFGLVAYSVSLRRVELGIRSALGARPLDLLKTTMGRALVLTGLGLGTGLAAAAYLTRFVESQLYGVSRLDPSTFLSAAVVTIAGSALATYLPARRAASADPMLALRRH